MSIQLKRSLISDIDSNYILKDGQPGIEKSSNVFSDSSIPKMKIGDGVTKWQNLPYLTDSVNQGVWISAESLGMKSGTDISAPVQNLPVSTPNIAFPAGNYIISSDTTFLCPVYFAPGAQITTSATVTFSKPIEAGRHQVFVTSSSGNFSIPNETVLPEWFGWFPTTPSTIATGLWSGFNRTITFDSGTYTAQNISLSNIIGDLTLIGNNTILDVSQLQGFSGNTFTLKNLTYNGTITQLTVDAMIFENCSISRSSSMNPQDIHVNQFIMLNCKVTMTGDSGTAIYLFNNSQADQSVIIDHCTVVSDVQTNNRAGFRFYRGIYADNAHMVVTNSSFTSVLSILTTLSAFNPSASFENCILNNSGLTVTGATPIFKNCDISTSSQLGNMTFYDCIVSCTNVTVTVVTAYNTKFTGTSCAIRASTCIKCNFSGFTVPVVSSTSTPTILIDCSGITSPSDTTQFFVVPDTSSSTNSG